MRHLFTVCAALVVVLGIVSGNLWLELRTARQQIVDLQNQLAAAEPTVAQLATVQAPLVQAPPLAVAAAPVPSAAVQLPESRPLSSPVTLPPPAALQPAAVRTVTVAEPAPLRAAMPRNAASMHWCSLTRLQGHA